MNNVFSCMNEAEQILILPHVRADWDCTGSAFALAEYLRAKNKTVTVCFEGDLPDTLTFLGGEWTADIATLGNTSWDLIIAVDTSSLDRLGMRKSLFTSCQNTLVIDHHISNTGFGAINYVVPDASATGEMLADLFLSEQIPISTRMAEYLYTAILSDTGNFRYSNTSAKTLRIAASLMEKGVRNNEINIALHDTASLASLNILSRALSHLTVYHNGKTAISYVTPEDMTASGCKESDLENLIDTVRSIQSAEVAAFIKPDGNEWKISLRSKFSVDVSEIAKAFGGGGHIRASGFSANQPPETTIPLLLAVIESAYRKESSC